MNPFIFVRFITHLKFFATRLFRDKMLDGDDRDFQELIQMKYPDAYECASKIARLVWQDYQIASGGGVSISDRVYQEDNHGRKARSDAFLTGEQLTAGAA